MLTHPSAQDHARTHMLNRKRIYENFDRMLGLGYERQRAWRLAVGAGKYQARMCFTSESPC